MVSRLRRRTTIGLALSAVVAVVNVAPIASVAAAPSAPQQAVDSGVAAARGDGVNQYVALVDRSTGDLVATSGGNTQVISESIVKLFTVGYYLVKYDGHLPSGLADDLHEMIVHSDDNLESRYWTTAAVPAMAARYGLSHTSNGPRTGPHDWGWEYITANDEAKFLYEASKDPVVGPFLTAAMAGVAAVGKTASTRLSASMRWTVTMDRNKAGRIATPPPRSTFIPSVGRTSISAPFSKRPARRNTTRCVRMQR